MQTILKFWFLGVFLVLTITQGYAQTRFQKAHGTTANENSYQIVALKDNSLVATGYTTSVSGNLTDAFLIKYNSFGEIIWSKTFGDKGDETAWDLIATSNNKIATVGVSSSFGTTYNVGTISVVDTSGKINWIAGVGSTTGNVEYYSLAETSTGHFIATGLAGSSTNKDEIILSKFGPKGKLLWSKTIGTSGSDEAMGIVETPQGDYLLAGLANDNNGFGSSDFAVVKTDSSGKVLWKKIYGGTSSERLDDIIILNNTYYFLGWSSSAGSGEDDVILMNTDTAGKINWVKAYGTTRNDRAFNILFDDLDSTFVITGYTETFSSTGSSSNRNSFLLKVDTTGKLLWDNSYGSTGRDGHWPTGVAINADTGYYVFSSTNSFGQGNYDLYLVKTNRKGLSGCNSISPKFSTSAVNSWSGQNFGSVSTGNFSSMVAIIFGSKWSPVTKSLCCVLYNNPGENGFICPGDSFQAGSPALPGYSYTWKSNGTAVSTQSMPYLTEENTYTLEVKGNNSGCSAVSKIILIDVDNKPDPGFAENYKVCDGDSVQLSTSVTADSFYWYSQNSGAVVKTGNSYTAKTTDTLILNLVSINSCNFKDTITTTLLAMPDPQLGADTVICEGGFKILNAGGQYSFKWLHDTTVNSLSIVADTAGIYVLKLTNDICSATDSITIGVNPSPTVSLGPDTVICPGSNVVLGASGNFTSHQWNNGSFGDSVVVTTEETVSIIVSNNFGCEGFDTVLVKVAQMPGFIFATDSVGLQNNPDTLDAGAGWETYLWGDSTQNRFLKVELPGWYRVTVTNKKGCSLEDSVYVSFITGLGEKAKELYFYPNPVRNFLYIKGINNSEGKTLVRFYSPGGKLIYQPELNPGNPLIIDVNRLEKGIYILEVMEGKMRKFHKVIVY